MTRTPAATPTVRLVLVVCLVLVAGLLAVLAPAALPPAHARSTCQADAAADVEDRSDGSIVDQPEADLVAVCAAWDGSTLDLAVRVAQPTDPATSPEWEDFATAVGFGIDTDGLTTEEANERQPAGEDFIVIMGRFPQDGSAGATPPEVRTMVGGTNNIAGDGSCIHPLLFDGVRYRVQVPASCLGAPAEVQVAAFMFFRANVSTQNEAGFFDEAPVFPDYFGPLPASPDPATPVTRLAGPSRIDTAITISRDDFADGAAQGAVLARATTPPDALAGAPLAVALDGPLLLTNSDILFDQVAEELQRVLPAGGTVHFSGGVAALDESVQQAVEDLGYTVVRAAGDSRYTTSIAVADATDPEPALIVVADGNTFPDALVGGALAAAERGVQILSNGSELTQAAADYLSAHEDAEVVAVGASAAAAVPSATALVGEDIFATSVAVAGRYDDPSGVALSSGVNFPDGLAGGAHAGRAGIPLLLSWPDLLPDSVRGYLEAQTPVSNVVIYGGVAALAYQIEADAQAALG